MDENQKESNLVLSSNIVGRNPNEKRWRKGNKQIQRKNKKSKITWRVLWFGVVYDEYEE